MSKSIDTRQIKAGFMAGCLTLIGLAFCDFIYFVRIWPNWQDIAQGQIPESRYISEQRKVHSHIHWQPIKGPFPRNHVRPFIIAEDSRFYSHKGIDLQAIEDALRYNLKARRWVFGASTISQQTVKNLVLSHDKTLFRKWHELVLTLAMERQLSKDQILILYLNIAQFGPNIFGVEAAARHYFSMGFRDLMPYQLAMLAASLPNPKRHNPSSRTSFFEKRHSRILAVLNYGQKPPSSAPKGQEEESTEVSRHLEELAEALQFDLDEPQVEDPPMTVNASKDAPSFDPDLTEEEKSLVEPSSFELASDEPLSEDLTKPADSDDYDPYEFDEWDEELLD